MRLVWSHPPPCKGPINPLKGSSARGLIIAIGTLLQTLPFGIVRRPPISLCVARLMAVLPTPEPDPM